MVAGTDHDGRAIKGKGVVHRHVKGAVPHGLSKIEEEIWKLTESQQLLKKETYYTAKGSKWPVISSIYNSECSNI